MRTVLVTAYDVDPFKGSEAGMGWNFIVQLARHYRVIAVTRENNRQHIERRISQGGSRAEAVRFLYYDLPNYLRWWKRGQRGSSAYFYLWQLTLPAFVSKTRVEFDFAHNLNFHADWAPSMLWTLGKPWLWGPIGHHPKVPTPFLLPYGIRERVKDRARWCTKLWFWHLDPFHYVARKRADCIVCMNSSVALNLRLHRSRTVILPSVGSEDQGWDGARPKASFRVLSVGRFVPLKGADLTLRAFAAFLGSVPAARRGDVSLALVGSGPEEARLKQLTEDLSLVDHVQFIPWMDRQQLADEYRRSSVFLFPSHEGAGMVVSEALSFGLPVICLDNVGPGELVDEDCAQRVPYRDYSSTVASLSECLNRLWSNPTLLQRQAEAARRRFERVFDWDRKGDILFQEIEARLP